MLEEIHREGGDVDKVIERAKNPRSPFRLMGFGHKLYRARDPRAFDVLSRVPATFEKVHFDRPDPVLMRYQRPHLCVRPPSWTSSLARDRRDAVSASGVVTSVFWAPMFEGVLRVPPDDVTSIERTRCDGPSIFMVTEATIPERPSARARPSVPYVCVFHVWLGFAPPALS